MRESLQAIHSLSNSESIKAARNSEYVDDIVRILYEYFHNTDHDIIYNKSLFEILFIKELDKLPALIDIEVYEDDNITRYKAFPISPSCLFVNEEVKSNEVYINGDIIHKVKDIKYIKEIGITVFMISEEVFKNIFKPRKMDIDGKVEGVIINGNYIVAIGNLRGDQLVESINAIVNGNEMIPEKDVILATFKDFLGSKYVPDCLKVTKVNRGEKYKVGDIIKLNGEIVKKAID